MKKIFVFLILFCCMSSVHALDCEKCNLCDSASSDYENCVASNCDNDVTLCSNGGNIESNTYGKIQCGDVVIPKAVPKLVSTIIWIIQIIVPVIVIILGLFDMSKAVTAGKDDDIKKGQKMLVNRIITGMVVFLLFVAVKAVIGLVAGDDKPMMDCVNCVINNKCG